MLTKKHLIWRFPAMRAPATQAMRPPVLLISLHLLLPLATLHAADAPVLVEPAENAVLTMAIPHFQWQRLPEARPDAMPSCDIQIASDVEFARVVDQDRLAAVIGWYVPDKELAPGDYWWRVAAVDAQGMRGAWSAPRRFSVRSPARDFKIAKGATLADMQRTVAEAARCTPARVTFEPGDYRLDPGEERGFIVLTNAHDLVIDGQGASIVLTHPVGWMDLRECRRVLIKNFTLDFDPPAYTAGRVVAADVKEGWMEADILPGHALPDDWQAYRRDTKGMVVDEAEGCAMKRGVPLVVDHAGFERVGGRRFRFRFEPAKAAGYFSPGDIYVLDPRWNAEGGGHGAFVAGGEDVVIFNLTIRSSANECFGSFYADRHALLHVKVERRPGRVLSVNNGGNNHHNARTGPWIEGCLFENCGDDVCHVNGYAMSVEAQPAPDRLVISRHQRYDQYGDEARLDLRSGDRLVFFCRATGRQVAEARVTAVVVKEKSVEVSVDRPVEGISSGRLSVAKGAKYAKSVNTGVTECYNVSRMCNQFVFRHNAARNSRRIGVLAKGDGGLVEGNLFEGLGGGGVEFWNAPFEGLAAENYVVSNNRILNCGRLPREHAAIWATIFKSGSDTLHRNLLVAGNEITGFPGPALLLRDIGSACVRDNRILLSRPDTAAAPGVEPITLSNTEGVKLDNNRIGEPGP